MTFFFNFRNHDMVRAFPSYSAKRCLGNGCNTKAQGMNPVLGKNKQREINAEWKKVKSKPKADILKFYYDVLKLEEGND